jgi:hypothetical protein
MSLDFWRKNGQLVGPTLLSKPLPLSFRSSTSSTAHLNPLPRYIYLHPKILALTWVHHTSQDTTAVWRRCHTPRVRRSSSQNRRLPPGPSSSSAPHQPVVVCHYSQNRNHRVGPPGWYRQLSSCTPSRRPLCSVLTSPSTRKRARYAKNDLTWENQPKPLDSSPDDLGECEHRLGCS